MSASSVGSIAPTNSQINAVVPRAVADILNERAKSLSLTRSKFASLVFSWWESQGCPPVTPADEAVLILKRGKGWKK